MAKETIMFGNIETEKQNFLCYKSPIFLEDVDIDNVVVSDKISSGKRNYRYFIGYLYDDYKIKPLHIMLPKTSAYVKSYDGQTRWMYLLIKDDDLLK